MSMNSNFEKERDLENINLYLRGKINDQTYSSIEKLKPKNKLMVFISSTFTDTHQERNILHEKILPELQKKAIKEDIQVLLYDMRFGVKDENTADHLTWIACREAIVQCFEESDGLFFLSLQGDKYGFMPLPKYVGKEALEHALKKHAEDEGYKDMEDSALEWYCLDENYITPQYELKGLKFLDHIGFWQKALSDLRDHLLDNLPFESLLNGEELLVHRSVTEWETLFALSLDKSKCFWMRRSFKKQSSQTLLPFRALDLYDGHNESPVEEKLKVLTKKMEDSLSQSQIYKFGEILTDDYLENSSNYLKHLKDWEQATKTQLSREIDNIASKKSSWLNHAENEFGISINYVEEIVHHHNIARLKSRDFIGRGGLVQQAMAILTRSKATQAIQATQATQGEVHRGHLDVALYVVGVSGAGKTAFMSKLAMEIQSFNQIENIPVIVRYCGTSQYSLHGKELVQSISIQILFVYDRKEELKDFIGIVGKQTYDEAVAYFRSLMLQFPIYLFIDSLDQLSNRYEARRKLNFLKDVKLHEKSKIVVSTLPDEKDEKTNQFKYLYFCEQRLKENNIRRIDLGMAGTNGKEVVQYILEKILIRRGKRLSPHQWRVVLNAAIFEPTMLYLNLSVEVISKWRSFEVDVILMPTVKRLIHQIFDDLERQYGKQLTSYALGLITYSRDGINDIELKDCLSMQKEVLKEVFQYSKIQSFPIHVWLRLKAALKHVIVEKENHCTKWYHIQLWETAGERYSAIRKDCHVIMGRYFGNLVDEEEKKEKGIHDQPLILNNVAVWLPSCKINSRRVREAYYHLVESGMINEAASEICSLELVCASAMLSDGYNLVSYLGQLYNASLKGSTDRHESCAKRIKDYFLWIRREMSTIMKKPGVQVLNIAGAEPMKSIVRKECEQIRKTFKKGAFNTANIVLCKTLHGQKDFGSLLSNWQGHSKGVTSVSWNHDGSKIASGSEDNTIKIWDATTGEVTSALEGHSKGITSISWNQDGSKIASGSWDKTIKIWDATMGEVTNTLEGHSNHVTSVSWNQDGSKIASGSLDNTVKIWDATMGEVIRTLEGHSKSVTSISWNHNGSKIASGSEDKTIKIWDASTGEVLSTFDAHRLKVFLVSWSHDGSKVASGSEDNTIKIWDATTGEVTSTLEGHSEGVTSVSWNQDGSKIASGSEDKTIKIWDASTGGVIKILEGHSNYVTVVSWNQDGSKIATGSYDETIKIWDATMGEVTSALEGHSEGVTLVSWNQDGSKIASGSEDMTIKIWDANTGGVISTLQGHNEGVTSVSWNHDASKIASGSEDKTIKIWNAITGEVIRTLEGHSEGVTLVSWNHDGSKIVSGSWDKTIKIWDITIGEVISTLEGHNEVVTSVSWNQDGSKIVSGSLDKTIKIWDITTGEVTSTSEGHIKGITSISWNQDGSKIASGSWDMTIKIWDATTGEVTSTLEGHSNHVTSVSWNQDGSKIVSGSLDKTIKIWDATIGEVIRTLEGHSKSVTSISWNQDGSKIASGSEDKTIKIWDGITWEVVR